jgi:hypothetical protein
MNVGMKPGLMSAARPGEVVRDSACFGRVFAQVVATTIEIEMSDFMMTEKFKRVTGIKKGKIDEGEEIRSYDEGKKGGTEG